MTTDRAEDEQRAARQDLSRERWSAHLALHEAKEEGLQSKLVGHWTLDDERWAAHAREHASIARNLADYKAQSNEWRGSLNDLRGTFAPNVKVDALESQLERRFEELRGMIATEREERRDQQNLRSGAVDTWKWIAGFLGLGGVSAIVWAVLNAPK